MKKLFVLAVVLGFLSTTALYATANNSAVLEKPQTIVFKNAKGDITFNHIKHMTRQGGVCTPCHKAAGAPIDVDKTFGHKVCKDCHKAVGNDYPNAPVRCTGCHVK